jgi:hypothetical protein
MAYDNYVRSYMGENLDSMPDYATALQIYEARKPYIKGKHKGERPLGKNRRHDRSRIRVEDNGDIVVKHWHTDIITYRLDGSIVLETGGWESISTAMIMQELLGVDRICRVNCKIYYRTAGQYYHIKPTLAVEPDGLLGTCNYEEVYVPNKGALKAYQNKYAFFLEYAKYVITMSNEFKYEHEGSSYTQRHAAVWLYTSVYEVCNTTNKQNLRREEFFNALDLISEKQGDDKLQELYQQVTILAYAAAPMWGGSDGCTIFTVNFPKFKQFFYELLKYRYAFDIFERKIANTGKPVRDPNAKYVLYGNDE